jgi:hypothetical protein
MKSKATILLALVMAMIAAAQASLASDRGIPSGVFTLNQIDKANAKALKDKKPLAFLYSSLPTTCPISYAETMEEVKEFKNKAIVVVGTDREKLPKVVVDDLQIMRPRSEWASMQPRVYITDMECKEILYTVRSGGEFKKEKIKASKKISEYRKRLDSPAKKVPPPPAP